jgi:hypothetical protein
LIKFMVIGLPRSRTTWMANWLTTTDTLCLHDPLAHYTIQELDNYSTDKLFGISDTAIHMFGGKLNSHPAKKLIIHRPLIDINKSLGQSCVKEDSKTLLDDIKGMHVDYCDLNRMGKDIWSFLIGSKFDSERFRQLIGMNVQPHFSELKPINKAKIQEWLGRN